MKCSEAVEAIPAAIDGQIGSDALSRLQSHLKECATCGAEFELERMTKSVVRKFSRSHAAPAHLVSRIRDAIRRHRAEAGARNVQTRRVRGGTLLAIGLSGAVLLFLTLVTPFRIQKHSHTQPADGNIIHQTYNNFDAVLNGSMQPAILSSDPSIVKAFFRPKVDFDVKFPVMKNFQLIGGICSDFHGKCIAQLLYKNADDVIYVYEVNLGTVTRHENGFEMSQEAMSGIERTGWYEESHGSNCALAARLIDSTVCCAVADINKDVLFASMVDFR